jgi:hypothetical protein
MNHTYRVAINNMIIPKLYLTKSEVAIRALVAAGNSTLELANKGVIAGIT